MSSCLPRVRDDADSTGADRSWRATVLPGLRLQRQGPGLRPDLRVRNPGLRQWVRTTLPLILGFSLVTVDLWIISYFASRIGGAFDDPFARSSLGLGLGEAASTAQLDQLARDLEAGAAAIVPKGLGPSDLIAVVEMALNGPELMAPADRHALLSRLRRHREARRKDLARFGALTTREAESLVLIAEGCGASEISDQWNVSMPTVRSHIRAVLTKLGVSSQLQAAAMARDSGWYATIAVSGSSILTMPTPRETGTIARRSGSQG